MKVLLTNLTKRNFRQDFIFQNPRSIELPAYALNHEVTFSCKEEFALFESLCASKIAMGEIAIGKMSENKAQDKNEGLEEAEANAKKSLNEQDKNNFETQVQATLGDTGAEFTIKTDKSKRESKK